MFKNYFKTAFRHLQQHKSYVLINTLGLGIAIAMCVVAYLNWKFDADFDKFHSNADKIFRVNTIKSSTQQIYGIAPAPLAAIAKNNVAGVKDAIAFDIWTTGINVADQTFYENIIFGEANFSKWFDFKLKKGTIDLDDPSKVVLTERMAKKYFGEEDPIGQTLTLYPEPHRKRDLQVSGVMENHPKNSSIYFDFITNKKNQVYRNGVKPKDSDWEQRKDALFLVLEKPTEAANVLTQLNQHIAPFQQANPDFGPKQYFLEPLTTMAAHSKGLRWNSLNGGVPDSAVQGYILMAILLLLTASLNFTNTTISLAGKRIKEIGVRKVMGGSRWQLIGQLLMESFMICLLALVIGLAFSDLAAGWYNQMWKSIELKVVLTDNYPLFGFLIATVLLTTLMAGAYPAFYMSSFNPNRIFHGSVKFGGTNLVSRVLLGVQVSISLIAIVFGLAFYQNADFQQNTDLGFNRTSIQAIYTADESTFKVMQNEIKRNPLVLATAGVRHHIGDSCPRYEFDLNGEKQEVEYMEVGENYLDVMDIQTLQGRPFSADLETDYQNAIMINEKFAEMFFPNKNPIGESITFFDTLQVTVIGVVRDFMQDSFFDPLRPLALKYSKADRFLYMAVRSESKDLAAVQTALASAWKTHFPTKPFEHNYQNEFLANAMEVTNNIKKTTSVLAIISVILTITGLFALMSLSILKRMKEIAVRRVLGASVGNISFIINRNYFWIILMGIIIGSGIGAWLSLRLLDSIYNIHAGVNSVVLFAAGLLASIAVLLTIGLKIWQVMQMNPAEVLKGD